MKPPTIGNIVRQRRQTLGWSLTALAEAAGCSKAYVSAIENDRLDNPPSRALLRRLEEALSLNEGDLVRRAEWQRTPQAVRGRARRDGGEGRSIPPTG
jgi:transcriptional regulator with XRE-family HTH domain